MSYLRLAYEVYRRLYIFMSIFLVSLLCSLLCICMCLFTGLIHQSIIGGSYTRLCLLIGVCPSCLVDLRMCETFVFLAIFSLWVTTVRKRFCKNGGTIPHIELVECIKITTHTQNCGCIKFYISTKWW